MKIVGRAFGILFFGILYWLLLDLLRYMPKADFFNGTTAVGFLAYLCAYASASAWDWLK